MRIKTLSVSEVNNYIKKVLDNDFILNNLSVKGEISNLKYHSSGHIYFSLKDDLGKINCIMFRNKAIDLEFKLKDGMAVIISGRASVYSANGTFQIYCDKIVEDGIGELHIKFEKLKEKLNEQGYFDNKYKKPLPYFPLAVGIVTSETGAAIEDIVNVIRRRNSMIDLVLYPAKVQGEYGYKTIIEGIKYFNKTKSVDVIIIGRGGGSIEELWNFNEELLAMAIFKSQIPIVSAVGHEVDFTISDFVSDVRAATPSQAGEIVAPMEKEILNKIENLENLLNSFVINKIDLEKKKLENYNRILGLNSPLNKIANAYQDIDSLKLRLDKIIDYKIQLSKTKLFSMNSLLQAHNPLNILSKGYAIIEDVSNNLLKSINNFKDENELKIILEDGFIRGKLTNIEKRGIKSGEKRKL